MSTRAPHRAAERHRHLVHFYEDGSDLRETVTPHLLEALRAGAGAVVIATEEHLRAFEGGLELAGVDLDGARAEKRWVGLDAGATLAAIMPAGELDAAAFEQVVGGTLREAQASGTQICAYGEMVQLLWSSGRVPAAIELEQLWNELQERLPFSLLCAYHREMVSDPDALEEFQRVCGLHSAVLRHFQPGIDAPRCARRFAAGVLRDSGHCEAVAEDVELVLSELATNAVVHARTPFSVTARADDAGVLLAVRDSNRAVPLPRERAISGRGLALVAALSAAWGFELDEGGKTVWAELRS